MWLGIATLSISQSGVTFNSTSGHQQNPLQPGKLYASVKTVRSSSLALKSSIDPIGYTKMGNLLEISKIRGEKECVMDDGNRCNLEIHRTNADALCAQALVFAGRLLSITVISRPEAGGNPRLA